MEAKKTFTFDSLPKTLDELKALPEAALTSPYDAVALTILAFCRFEESPEDCYAMYDFLLGPEDLSTYKKQFIKDRLKGKEYVARSYMAGTSPANNYTPSKPYSITVYENPYSYQEEGRAKIFVKSSGADTERSIALRNKPSTGQWFVTEEFILPDIRIPAAADKWA